MKTIFKKFTPKIILTLAILLTCHTSQAQIINLNPDSVFHDSNSHEYYWSPDQTNLYGYNGNIYFISLLLQDWSLVPTVSVYTINHKGQIASFKMKPDNENYFRYGFDDEMTWYQGSNGVSIAFEYNGAFWHYHNIQARSSLINPSSDSYDCFARFPADNTQPYHAYYDLMKGSLSVVKKGAFQHDSTLYFLGISVQKSDPNYGKWCIQKYTYDKANDKFIWKKNTPLAGAYGNMLGGLVPHTDSAGNTRFVMNTYTENNTQVYLGWLDATTPPGGETTFTFSDLYPNMATLQYCKASVLIGGSAKGGRTIDNMDNLHRSERMLLFGFGNNGTSVINYQEYMFPNDYVYYAGEGSVVLPSSMTPCTREGKYNLIGATELIPNKFNNVIGSQANGYVQQNWIYYPDSRGKICGLRFQSDYWKPIPDSTIFNDDLGLDQVSDSTYGPQVRSLWTLAGIVDNAPPSSINWHVWDSCYYSDYRPTELALEIEGEFSSTVKVTTEDKYTLGGEISSKSEKGFIKLDSKISQSFKNAVSSSITWSNTLSMPFELNEESQSFGKYIYVIPTITRYTYKRFPWWDPAFKYPVSRSKQFRFSTTSTAVIYRDVEINEFPFQVNDPNASNLNGWKLANRTLMNTDVRNSGIQPFCNPFWSSGSNGQTGTLQQVTDTSSEFSHATSYSVDASFGGKKPKVFEFQVSAGLDVDYETTTENETSLSKKIEVSLHNLVEKQKGVNLNSYTVNAYLFRPEQYNWWYLDSMGTDRPWYISYTVTNVSGALSLISPRTGELLKTSGGMIFSWESPDLEVAEYSLFICRTSHIDPSETVYRISAGLGCDQYLNDLPFCEAGKTYYWAVRATTREGDILWSESRPFAAEGQNTGNQNGSGFIAIPYPNPGNAEGLRVLVDTKETGTVGVKITSLSGSHVYQCEANHDQPGAQSIDLPGLHLNPGIYLIALTINENKVIKKLLIR